MLALTLTLALALSLSLTLTLTLTLTQVELGAQQGAGGVRYVLGTDFKADQVRVRVRVKG